MRILALTHVFPRAEDDPQAPFLLTWARALVDARAQVTVVAPHDAGLPSTHRVGGIGVRLARYAPESRERIAYRGEMHRLALSPGGALLTVSLLTSLAMAVRRQVAVAKPDVLHVHWWVPGAIAARLAAVRIPTVVTVHGTDIGVIERRPRLARLARWALGGADRVEAVSSDLAERLKRATGRTADAVNPMPLDPARLLAVPAAAREPGGDGALRVLAVGRLVPEKGFADVIAAAARLEQAVDLTIFGEGPERERLAALAERLGVQLRLPGSIAPEALRLAYAQADVVVQASHREGLGLVAAEAVCAGTPVVATDSGGVRDILGHDGLVAVGDVAGLAAALECVASDPEAARARAAAAAEMVRSWLSPAAAAARTLAGYAELPTV